MPGLYDQMYPNPFLQILDQQRRQQQLQQEAASPVMPEEQQSALGRLMESGLGGLSYLGKILDKTFGGRAVRGVLGGRPEELLSVLPLSDTLGITNEANTVHGSDLLNQAGLTTPGDDSFENQVAGVAAEIALDPAIWVGAAVPRLVGRGLQSAGRTAGAGVQALSGVNPYTYGARQLGNLYEAAKVPVRTLFDTSVAGAATRAGQGLAEDVFTPTLKRLQTQADFDVTKARNAAADLYNQAVAGARTVDRDQVYKGLSQVAEGFGDAGRTTMGSAGLLPTEVDQLHNLVAPFAQGTRDVSGLERSTGVVSKELNDLPPWTAEANAPVRQAVEEANRAVNAAQARYNNAAATLPPGHPTIDAAQADLTAAQDELARASAVKLPFPGDLPFMGFQPAEYAPRTLAPYGDAESLARARSQRLSGVSPFQASREDVFRGIPGGTATLNEWALDPALSTTKATMSEMQANNYIAQQLTGLSAVPADHPVWETAKALQEKLRRLPPEALQKGFFSADVFGAAHARRLEAARTVASGETVLEGVRRFAEPVAAIEARGERYVRVPDLLGNSGLTHVDAAGVPVAADAALAHLNPALHATTGTAKYKALEGYAVPADVAADMQKIGQAWKTPASLQPVVDMWDRTVKTFKDYLTKVFPAFSMRNLMSGIFNMWRDDAMVPKAGSEMMNVLRGGALDADVAKKLYPGMAEREATQAFRDELMANRVAFTRSGQTGERVGMEPAISGPEGILLNEVPQVGAKAPRPLSEDVGGFLGGFIPEKGKVAEQLNPFRIGFDGAKPNLLLGQADKLGNAVEDWIRGSHYLAKRLEGASVADARMSVMKYQIDYCVDESTHALSKRGWLRMDQIKVGDEILTITPDGELIEWQPVQAVNIFPSPGKLARWRSNRFDALTTANHRWLARGSSFRGGHHTLNVGRPRTHFVTTGEVADGNQYKRLIVSGGTPVAGPGTHPDELVELVGWYITKGWPGNNPWAVYVSQSESHNPARCERIRKLATHFREQGATVDEYGPRDSDYGPVITWYFDKGIGEQVRHVAPNKELTMEFLLSLSPDQQRLLYTTMMAADGTTNPNGVQTFTQKDPKRTHAFQILCSLLGLRTAVRHNGKVHHVSVYSHADLYVDQLERTEEEYVGMVWCPTTANGTWLARRHGFTYWTGNSDLTQFEKNVMKRVFPWYTFSRKNLPPLLEDLVNKPGKVAAATRAITGSRTPGEFVPPWVAEGASIPIPGGPDGESRYISGFGSPMEDEVVKALGSALHGDYQRVLQQAFGMSQPFVKLPAELATNTQMYSGRKLEDLKPYEFADLGGLLSPDVARMATQVVANTPASRFASTANKLMDERKGAVPTALNTLSGVMVTDVDTERVRDRAAADMLKGLLRGKPGVRTMEELYVKPEGLPMLSPQELMQYDLLKEIERRQQRRAAEKKKAEAR